MQERQSDPKASRLVQFYAGGGTDAAGRSLGEILAWPDARLEAVHDYIQWLFPLPEPSGFNARAPLLTRADAAAFAADPVLRDRLDQAFARMLAFYGFRHTEAGVAADPAGEARLLAWATPGNHNLLRITRILRALTLLGLGDRAQAFLGALMRLCEGPCGARIGTTSPRFWRAAVVPAWPDPQPERDLT